MEHRNHNHRSRCRSHRVRITFAHAGSPEDKARLKEYESGTDRQSDKADHERL